MKEGQVGNGRDEAERGVLEAIRQGKESEYDPLDSSPCWQVCVRRFKHRPKAFHQLIRSFFYQHNFVVETLT